MIARVAAVLSSSRDWKANVLQFAPDCSQPHNETLQVTNTSHTKLGKTCNPNLSRWRRGSCATRIPSLLKPIFSRIAARKGLGTVSRPDTIERAPCSIFCQYLGQATHKIFKRGLQAQKRNTSIWINDSYRYLYARHVSKRMWKWRQVIKRCYMCQLSSLDARLTCKKEVLHAVFLHCFLVFVRWRQAIFMVPGDEFGIWYGTSNKVLG